MPNDAEHHEEWRARFQVVGRAQARYLYVLLIAGVFYWALHVQVMSATSATPAEQQLPVVGVNLNRAVVWATAPTALGLIMLAALGTFHALSRASQKLGALAQGDEGFERLDAAPTAIDFIVYSESRWLSRLGRLSYPSFLSLVLVEACWIWLSVFRTSSVFSGRGVLLIVGAVVLILCLPRLFSLWLSKGRRALVS